MSSYRIEGDHIVRSDEARIPMAAGNRDYQEYMAWVAAGGVPSQAVAPTLEERKEQEMAALAARRYQAEIGGTVFNGWPVITDRASQALITAAYQMARDGYWSGGWKFADGMYRLLSGEQVISLALTIGAWVETCFFHESVIAAQIRAATDESELVWSWE